MTKPPIFTIASKDLMLMLWENENPKFKSKYLTLQIQKSFKDKEKNIFRKENLYLKPEQATRLSLLLQKALERIYLDNNSVSEEDTEQEMCLFCGKNAAFSKYDGNDICKECLSKLEVK